MKTQVFWHVTSGARLFKETSLRNVGHHSPNDREVTSHNLCVQQHRCDNIEPHVLPYRLAFSTTAIKQNTPRILTVQNKFQQNVRLSGANIDVDAANDNLKFSFSLYAVCNFETPRYIYIYIYIDE
jgi:hypothetical protein